MWYQKDQIFLAENHYHNRSQLDPVYPWFWSDFDLFQGGQGALNSCYEGWRLTSSPWHSVAQLCAWLKTHWQWEFARMRGKNDQIFHGEIFSKFQNILPKNFQAFSVELSTPRRTFICKFYESATKCGFRTWYTRFILPFPKMVKNDKIGQKALKTAFFCRFEHLIQTF